MHGQCLYKCYNAGNVCNAGNAGRHDVGCGVSLSSQTYCIAACACTTEGCHMHVSCSLACLSSAMLVCRAFSEASLHSAHRIILLSLKPGVSLYRCLCAWPLFHAGYSIQSL